MKLPNMGGSYQLGDVHAPRVKGDFGRVHGERASFAINLIVSEGEYVAKASGYGVTGVGGTPLGEKVVGARSER